MKTATRIILTPKILSDLDFNEVIYGERSQAGAMGNSGGIILYVIHNNEFIRYDTNCFRDEETARLALEKIANNENLFETYLGGFGNGVFINKNVNLDVAKDDTFFLYIMGGIEYQIVSSVFGVFDEVAKALKGKQENTDPVHKAWEESWRQKVKS